MPSGHEKLGPCKDGEGAGGTVLGGGPALVLWACLGHLVALLNILLKGVYSPHMEHSRVAQGLFKGDGGEERRVRSDCSLGARRSA